MIRIIVFTSFLLIRTLASSPTEDLEALIRQPELHPTSLVRVVDPGDFAELEEQAKANVSTLSNISLADIENDNVTHTLQMKYRERKRQERLLVIQTQILQRLRIQKQPNITSSMFSEDDQKKIEMMVGRMQNMKTADNDLYGSLRLGVQRLQSFYPSCSLPNHTDRNTWENPSSFRMFYDIPFNRRASVSDITILRAKLRLYKLGDSSVDPNYVSWESHLSSLPRYNQLDSLLPRGITNAINVNIYQFMKPVRLNRKERKRVVDSRTILADYKGWVEFDVLPSLNYWLQHNNKNYGFDVAVEDSFGHKLNTSLHFQSMNCSVESATQDPPFPNFMELNTDMGENESSLFDNETYPTLDLKTAEITREDSELQVGDFSSRVLKKRHVYSQRIHRNLKSKCRREQTFVSFAEMGLDGIIVYPEGVNWSFCSGSCDDSQYQSLHKRQLHRKNFLQQMFPHWHFPWHRTQESNCIAGDKDSLSVIYYDEDSGELRKTTIHDLIPKNCICKST